MHFKRPATSIKFSSDWHCLNSPIEYSWFFLSFILLSRSLFCISLALYLSLSPHTIPPSPPPSLILVPDFFSWPRRAAMSEFFYKALSFYYNIICCFCRLSSSSSSSSSSWLPETSMPFFLLHTLALSLFALSLLFHNIFMRQLNWKSQKIKYSTFSRFAPFVYVFVCRNI